MKYPKYTTRKRDYSQFEPIQAIEGERIEDKIRRVIDNKEPITDGAPIIYTERKLGVLPAYNIRTDRWEIAQAAMEVNQKAFPYLYLLLLGFVALVALLLMVHFLLVRFRFLRFLLLCWLPLLLIHTLMLD